MPLYQRVSFKLNLPLSDAFDIYMHFALFKYRISSDNSRPSINRLPGIPPPPFDGNILNNRPPRIIAPQPSRHLLFLLSPRCQVEFQCDPANQ